MTTATAAAETITNPHHTVLLEYFGGPVAFSNGGPQGVIPVAGGFFDPGDPYNQFVEVFDGALFDPNQTPVVNTMFSIISSGGQPPFGHSFSYYFEVFADTPADYSASTAPISIDLTNTFTGQHGGFADGDTLINVSEVIGSPFNDIIRGSNVSDFPADSIQNFTINNPGENLLIGGDGDDVLEGRGGADILMGGAFTNDFGFDFASYESSP